MVSCRMVIDLKFRKGAFSILIPLTNILAKKLHVWKVTVVFFTIPINFNLAPITSTSKPIILHQDPFLVQ